MAIITNIGWTNSTASPWFICTEVSPGCANCYARLLTEQKFAFVSSDPAKPSGVIREAYKKAGFKDWAERPVWGKDAVRVLSKGFWAEVFKWDAKAAVAGKKLLLFPSLMDWLDDMPAGCIDQNGRAIKPESVLSMLLEQVFNTPNIVWQLLTKRPEAFRTRLAGARDVSVGHTRHMITRWLDDGLPPSNVWVGATVECKSQKGRLDDLRRIPARLRFASFEPLLEDLGFNSSHELAGIHWGIIGGESGEGRRDCGVAAITSVAESLRHVGVKCYVKQDCHQKPGQQGRIPDHVWSMKEIPEV